MTDDVGPERERGAGAGPTEMVPSAPVVNRPSLAGEPTDGTISVSRSECSSPRFWNFVAMFSTVNGSTLTVPAGAIVAEPSPGRPRAPRRSA